jgi:iron complex outermembrane recepter protein
VKRHQKVSLAVSTVLAASSAGLAMAADSGGLEEIVVTATRRSETIQNVPITIQAVTGESLGALGVSTFDDVLRLLPNVTFSANGPGQGNIYMRGLSAGFAGNQSSATVAPMPNVATYYDDQAMSFPARNADVYMVDMERVEVLEGPQGTLFGGGAEAGAVRYITNKPKLNKFEGQADMTYGTTAHGDPNSALTGIINLPIISDKLALRIAMYNDRRGGYIDNVPTDFTRLASDPGPGAWGASYPANALVGASANNYALAAKAQNPATYTGMRASALLQVNDDWSVLLQQTYQNLDAEGMNAQYPYGSNGQKLNAWEETSFSPTYDKDKYSSTAWTVNGKINDLSLVYTGSYLSRHIEQNMDYTNYARTAYGFYYECTGGPASGAFGSGQGKTEVCYSPVSSWHDTVYNTHLSHEMRLSTPTEWRLRGLVGAFWERMDIKDDQNFMYKSIPSCTPANLAASLAGGPTCVANVIPLAGTAAIDPTMRNDNVAYGQDVDRNFTQTAFFASVDYDLVPKVLTATLGTRYYNYAESMFGSRYLTSTPNVDVPNGSVAADLIDPNTHRSDYSGFRSRANLTWHPTEDTMVYYTFSQGYRPGSFNRIPSKKTTIYIDPATGTAYANDVAVPGTATKAKQFVIPNTYAPDLLVNNEIGFKSEFMDHRLQVNGSYYQMDWKNVQTLIYNPLIFGNGTFGIAGPDYRIKGIELQIAAKLADGLTFQGAYSHNNSSQTNSPCVESAGTAASAHNPVPAGSCITQYATTNAAGQAANEPIINPLGAVGSTPAFSPTSQWSAHLRYEWNIDAYKAFASIGGNYTGAMSNTPSSFKAGVVAPITQAGGVPTTTWSRYQMDAYTTVDGSFGVGKDNWTAEVYGTNLTNSDASQFTSSGQWILAQFPLRPRVVNLKVSVKF